MLLDGELFERGVEQIGLLLHEQSLERIGHGIGIFVLELLRRPSARRADQSTPGDDEYPGSQSTTTGRRREALLEEVGEDSDEHIPGVVFAPTTAHQGTGHSRTHIAINALEPEPGL